MESIRTMELLRKRLLGTEGPYADIRESIDQLDNVKLWIRGLDASAKLQTFQCLLPLVIDENVELATAAVLSLDYVSEHFDSKLALEILEENNAGLYRSPIRLNGASFGTILEELFFRLCKYCIGIERKWIEQFLLQTKDPTLRDSLFCFLVPNYPTTVVYYAHRMLNHQNTHVIVGLSNHWERVAVATALRPWPAEAIERVRHGLTMKKTNGLDIEAIVRVMRDDDELLTCPSGLQDSRRWWMIAGEPYRWTMWETTDGSLACEVLQSGPAFSSTSRILSEWEVIHFHKHRAIFA
jgi:hypothetical protein